MTKWLKLANSLRITGGLKIGIVLMDPVSFRFQMIPAAAHPCWPSTDIDDLLPASKQSTISYFFFRDGDSDQMTTMNAGCAILRQIFLPQPHLPRNSSLDQSAADREKLTQLFGDLWSIFTVRMANPSVGEIICILGSLDKCQNDEGGGLIEEVMRFHQGGVGRDNLEFHVTTRPYT
jgi:hypothetical protein